ncbi:MAG: protein kinase, partial [bacterium]
IDHRSDIFSLGVLAYHLLTGRRPFRGRTDSELLERIKEGKLEPLTADSCPLLTDELLDLIQRMLEKSPTDRPQTMDEVIQKTTECLIELDPHGEFTLYRRKHLAQFAADPAAYLDSRRDRNITRHLQRGERFRNLAPPQIEDAIREYRFVVALDPEHAEALAALCDLESQVDDQQRTLTEIDKQDLPEETTRTPEEAPDSDPVGHEEVSDQQPLTNKTEEGEDPEDAGEIPEEDEAGADSRPPGRSWLWWLISIPVLLGLWLLIKDQITPQPKPVPTPPIPITSIFVNSVPSGASVWSRGPGELEFRDSGEVTDCLISDLAVGEWAVRIALEDYIADTLHIELVANVPKYLNRHLKPLVGQGLLSVSSEPRGATLILRDTTGNIEVFRGPEPIEELLLKEGTYQLRAELADHHPWNGPVTVVKDIPTHETVPLQAIPQPPPPVEPDTVVIRPPPPKEGYLRINNEFRVVVKIDNAERWLDPGFTVLTLSPTREYDLLLHRPETFSKSRQTVTVDEGDTTVIDDRVFKCGTLVVGADAPCRLEIDGVKVEREDSYHKYDIGTGRHLIRFTCPSFMVKAVELTDAEGSATVLYPTASGDYQINISEGKEFCINVELRRND